MLKTQKNLDDYTEANACGLLITDTTPKTVWDNCWKQLPFSPATA